MLNAIEGKLRLQFAHRAAIGKAGINGKTDPAALPIIHAIGTPAGVQQKLMRHSDIRVTMNIYGDAQSAEMLKANGKIAELAFSLE